MYNNHSLDDEDGKYRLKSSLLHHGKSSTASAVEGDEGSPEAGAAAASEAITSHEESNISSKDSGRGDGSGDSGSRYDHTNTSRRHVGKVLMENIGHCLAICTFLGLIVGIPTLFFCMAQDKQLGKDYAAFYSAGLFVMLTVPISIREITKHLTNWYMPEAQKYVVRILWMVPIYSMNSWLSLRFHDASLYIDTIRDFYEAFVLISFFYFLVELLGGENALSATLTRKDEQLGKHPFFVHKILDQWEMGPQFLLKCKNGVLQYVVIKTLTTMMISFSESVGIYGEGTFSWNRTYIYIATMTNFSQMYALYCLVKFYFATESELKNPIDWKPVGKFLCIKGVIFFTWWQGVLIAILKSVGIIDEIGSWDANDVAQGLQDYFVCIEMFLFAIAHSFTFTYTEYVTVYNELDVNNHGDNSTVNQGHMAYSPPAVAPRMSARRALWSSAVPTETMMDIHNLRRGLMHSTDNHSEKSDLAATTELSATDTNF